MTSSEKPEGLKKRKRGPDLFLKPGGWDRLVGIAQSRGVQIGGFQKDDALTLGCSARTLSGIQGRDRPVSKGMKASIVQKLKVTRDELLRELTPDRDFAGVDNMPNEQLFNYLQWLGKLGDLGDEIRRSQEVFLQSTCSRLLVGGDADDQIRDLQLDYLYVYGAGTVLRFKRLRGFATSIFVVPRTSLQGGSVTNFNFIHEDNEVRLITTDQDRTQCKSFASIDFLSVACFRDDIPRMGDWISVETRKYTEGGSGALRFGLLSCHELKDFTLWGMAEAGSGEFVTRLRFFYQEMVSRENPAGKQAKAFSDWFDILDDLRPSEFLPRSGEARRFLDSCLSWPDIRSIGVKRFAELPEAAMRLHRYYGEIKDKLRPTVVTFRFRNLLRGA